MAFIKRNKENPLRFRTMEGSLTVYPGVNEINEDTAVLLATPKGEDPKEGTLKEVPLYQELLENGVHEVVGAKVKKSVSDTKDPEDPSKSESDITKMNATDAKKIIEGILSIAQLEKIKGDEAGASARKSVLTAIDDQIEDIKRVPDED